MASNINADNGVVSGSAGLKTSADSTGVLALQTNGTTAVTVNTSQNVGIGTTSPASLVHLQKGVANGPVDLLIENTIASNYGSASLSFKNDIAYSAGLSLMNSTRVNYGSISANSIGIYTSNTAGMFFMADGTGGNIRFSAGGSGEVARFNVNGLGLGGAIPSSGTGITFPATQSASTDANTLDDYEEGTWTPAITDDIGAAVMTSGASGFYTKVGRLVTVTFNEISWSSKGTLATAPLYVSGLPFTSRSTNRSVGQFGPASASSFTNANRLVPTLEANATKVSLFSINATSNQGTDYSVSSLGTSGVLYAFSLTYFV